MQTDSPLKRFFWDTSSYWDHTGTPLNVRENLWKIIRCGTPALGANVYSSETEQKIVYHTCKSRFCPSCGVRAASLWQDDLEVVLPNVQYREINFTMPKVFWPIFQQNRALLNGLPGIGARVIQYWAKAVHGARVILMVVQQTYGGFLNFYPHLHTLVSAGGLDENGAQWVPDLDFGRKAHQHELMLAWRYALLAYVNFAVQGNILKSQVSLQELDLMLRDESQRPWNIYVGPKRSHTEVINHIGRYIRKPPVSQRRFKRLDDQTVQYIAKDTRNRRLIPRTYTNREFLALVIPHVADRYCNSMRYFGLLAPRCTNLLALVFDLLKEPQRPRPVRLSWAVSLERTFGNNPLVGRDGSKLEKIGYLEPVSRPIVTAL